MKKNAIDRAIEDLEAEIDAKCEQHKTTLAGLHFAVARLRAQREAKPKKERKARTPKAPEI